MKLLCILLILCILHGCAPDISNKPDQVATVVITSGCSLSDTIIVEYYKGLTITYGNELRDANGSTFAVGVQHFSIIQKHTK